MPDRDFDAPVARSSFFGVVAGNGLAFAFACDAEAVDADAALYEPVADRACSAFG